MSDKATATPFASRYAELERKNVPGPEWVRHLRRDGWSRFAESGLPSPKSEDWKNTNVTALGQTEFEPAGTVPATVPALSELASTRFGSVRLVFVDGRYDAAHSSVGSLPDGVRVESLAAALENDPEAIREQLLAAREGEPEFRALNDALLEDGAVVRVDDGVSVAEPIELIFAASGRPTACHPRTLIVAGQESRATVVECFTGADGGYFTNAVCDVVLGDAARIDHLRIQTEGPEAYHVSTRHSNQGRDSLFRTFSFDFGGKLVRHNVRARLGGEGGNCEMFGLYLTRDRQHVDNHTTLDHAVPRCDSRELYKGVLDDRSRSVFSGRIIVREDAQKTDAKQSNPNLLLSDTALAHTRPQLEIYADDVKCTHGATVGRMDDDAVFYLRSRGIGLAEARRMMVEAFCGEVVERVDHDGWREALSADVARRLTRA